MVAKSSLTIGVASVPAKMAVHGVLHRLATIDRSLALLLMSPCARLSGIAASQSWSPFFNLAASLKSKKDLAMSPCRLSCKACHVALVAKLAMSPCSSNQSFVAMSP